MHALIDQAPGQYALEDKPEPALPATTDAIVQITKTTICSTDLPILQDAGPVVTAGGYLANIGVQGKPVQLNLDGLWERAITLTTRLVDTVTTPMLMKTVMAGKIKPRHLITHHLPLGETLPADDAFGQVGGDRALKIVIQND